ncbi:MAG: hypothetical protein L0I76_22050 [Pseudonocardia sp.]|nr:hypothetical protein [Pseudonocardia sp.]
MHQLVQDPRPGGALVGAPVLFGDERVDEGQGLDLVDDGPPAIVDEVPPPGVRGVAVAGDPVRGATSAVGEGAGEPAGSVAPQGALAGPVLGLPRCTASWRP